MALSIGQATAGTGSSVLFTLPADPASGTVLNSGTVTAYLGAGTVTAVSSSNGFPLPAGQQVPISVFQGDAGTPIVVTTGAANAVVGYIVSTPSGGTGV